MAAKGSDDRYAGVIADLEAQRASIDTAIAALKALQSGKPVPGSIHGTSATNQSSGTTELFIEIDTFHKLTLSQAIKKYLGMRPRKPATTQDIVDALTSGGQNGADGANFSTVVTNSLNRMAAADGEVSKVKRGIWGLKAWYEPKPKHVD